MSTVALCKYGWTDRELAGADSRGPKKTIILDGVQIPTGLCGATLHLIAQPLMPRLTLDWLAVGSGGHLDNEAWLVEWGDRYRPTPLLYKKKTKTLFRTKRDFRVIPPRMNTVKCNHAYILLSRVVAVHRLLLPPLTHNPDIIAVNVGSRSPTGKGHFGGGDMCPAPPAQKHNGLVLLWRPPSSSTGRYRYQ